MTTTTAAASMVAPPPFRNVRDDNNDNDNDIAKKKPPPALPEKPPPIVQASSFSSSLDILNDDDDDDDYHYNQNHQEEKKEEEQPVRLKGGNQQQQHDGIAALRSANDNSHPPHHDPPNKPKQQPPQQPQHPQKRDMDEEYNDDQQSSHSNASYWNEKNTCIICLDSIHCSRRIICAMHPCGHVLHEECFAGFAFSAATAMHKRHHGMMISPPPPFLFDTANNSNNDDNYHYNVEVNCPTCKVKVMGASRLFLDLQPPSSTPRKQQSLTTTTTTIFAQIQASVAKHSMDQLVQEDLWKDTAQRDEKEEETATTMMTLLAALNRIMHLIYNSMADQPHSSACHEFLVAGGHCSLLRLLERQAHNKYGLYDDDKQGPASQNDDDQRRRRQRQRQCQRERHVSICIQALRVGCVLAHNYAFHLAFQEGFVRAIVALLEPLARQRRAVKATAADAPSSSSSTPPPTRQQQTNFSQFNSKSLSKEDGDNENEKKPPAQDTSSQKASKMLSMGLRLLHALLTFKSRHYKQRARRYWEERSNFMLDEQYKKMLQDPTWCLSISSSKKSMGQLLSLTLQTYSCCCCDSSGGDDDDRPARLALGILNELFDHQAMTAVTKRQLQMRISRFSYVPEDILTTITTYQPNVYWRDDILKILLGVLQKTTTTSTTTSTNTMSDFMFMGCCSLLLRILSKFPSWVDHFSNQQQTVAGLHGKAILEQLGRFYPPGSTRHETAKTIYLWLNYPSGKPPTLPSALPHH